MIIICDNCGTRYHIKEQDIGDEGREVRCTRCAHVWIQSPFSHDDTTSYEETDVEFFTNDETLIHNKSTFWLKISTVILLLLIVVALFFSPRDYIMPFLRPMYSVFNIYDSSGLEFHSANYEHYKINHQDGILIAATIINNSDEIKIVPNMRISMYAHNANEVQITNVESNLEYLAPGEVAEVTQHFSKLSQDVQYIALDIGNKLEMWFK